MQLRRACGATAIIARPTMGVLRQSPETASHPIEAAHCWRAQGRGAQASVETLSHHPPQDPEALPRHWAVGGRAGGRVGGGPDGATHRHEEFSTPWPAAPFGDPSDPNPRHRRFLRRFTPHTLPRSGCRHRCRVGLEGGAKPKDSVFVSACGSPFLFRCRCRCRYRYACPTVDVQG